MSERDMYKIYAAKSRNQLLTLKSAKLNQIARLERSWGYLDKQMVRQLRWHIKSIDAVLASRELQQKLDLP